MEFALQLTCKIQTLVSVFGSTVHYSSAEHQHWISTLASNKSWTLFLTSDRRQLLAAALGRVCAHCASVVGQTGSRQ